MRINPGQITSSGGDLRNFDNAMTQVAGRFLVWPTPSNLESVGAKVALTKFEDLATDNAYLQLDLVTIVSTMGYGTLCYLANLIRYIYMGSIGLCESNAAWLMLSG